MIQDTIHQVLSTNSCNSEWDRAMQTFTKNDTNVVKGVAIIMMIFHHCFLNSKRYAGQVVSFAPFAEYQVNYVTNAFKICVGIFTLLSAYGMTKSYQALYREQKFNAEHITRSIVRRYFNLMGGYVFVFLFLQAYSAVMGLHRYVSVYGTGLRSILNFAIDFFGLGAAFGTDMFIATFWYMSLAQVVILLVPLFYSLVRRSGVLPLLGITLLARALVVVNKGNVLSENLFNYLFVTAVGIAAAEFNMFEVMRKLSIPLVESKTVRTVAKILLELAVLAVAIVCRQATRWTPQLPFWEGLVCFFVCAFVYEFISPVSILGRTFAFLGRHSMNIFLVHNFIRVAWYYDFTYSFNNFMTIAFVLLVLSLCVSIVLEGLKRALRYNRAIERIHGSVDNRIKLLYNQGT